MRASGTYSHFWARDGEIFVVPGREQPDAVKALPSPLITNTRKEVLRAKNSNLFRAQPVLFQVDTPRAGELSLVFLRTGNTITG